MRNFLRGLWRAYERQLEGHPLPTQVTTSGLLWGTGDILAQKIEHFETRQKQQQQQLVVTDAQQQAQPWQGAPKGADAVQVQPAAAAENSSTRINWHRAALTAIFGATTVGPVGHFWYLGIDKWCRSRFRPGSAAFIGTKVALDTVTMGPFYVASFFGFGTACIDRGSWGDFVTKMRTDFVPTLLAEFTVWPLVQTVNFARVPVQHQLLVVNGMTVADAAFMSWARNKEDWLGGLLGTTAGPTATQDAAASCREQPALQPRGGTKTGL